MLLWTMMTGFWIPGLLMIAVAESGRWHSRRWDFQERDDRRFVNAGTIALIVGLIYSWLNPQGAFTLLESAQIGVSSDVLGNRESFQPYEFIILITPLLIFPLFWACRFRSTSPPTYSIFSRFIPRKVREEATWLSKDIPSEGGYAFICLTSTCKTQSPGLTFFVLISVVLGWFLWENRPGSRNQAPWVIHLVTCVVAAFFFFSGLAELQTIFQEKFINYIALLSRRDPIPKEARTAIGRAGKINLSANIVLRAETDIPTPFLLPQDYFDEYRRGTWQISDFKSVTNVLDDGDLETWTLRLPSATHTNRSEIRLSHSLNLDSGRLPLPMGSYRLSSLPVGEVLTNVYGRVSVVDGPGLIRYSVEVAPQLNSLAPKLEPGKRTMKEFDISTKDQKYIKELAPALGIENPRRDIPAREIARRVSDFFFTNNFVYSAQLKPEELPERGDSALEHFLFRTRKGHCEYYASATVLLMRHGGIPARYVVGYSMDEKRNGQIIARERDRHAWCQYFSFEDDQWCDLDTTPGEWREVDAGFSSPMQPALDFLNDILFILSNGFWIWVQKIQEFEVLMGVFLVLLFGFLIFRIIRQQNQRRMEDSRRRELEKWKQQGLDSAFFTVMNQLEKMGYHRADGETVFAWLQNRVPDSGKLLELARIHYQYRFDPNELDAARRDTFFTMALEQHRRLVSQAREHKQRSGNQPQSAS